MGIACEVLAPEAPEVEPPVEPPADLSSPPEKLDVADKEVEEVEVDEEEGWTLAKPARKADRKAKAEKKLERPKKREAKAKASERLSSYSRIS